MNQNAGNIVQGASSSFTSKTILLIIKACFSIGLLIYLFRKADLRQFIQVYSSINPLLILSSGLIYIGCQYMSSYRWHILLKAHDVSVPVNRLFSFYLVGMFFNNFLPTSVGGDVVKGYDLYRYSGKGKEAITTVFLERYTGLVALIAIGLMALVIGYTHFADPVVTILLVSMAAAFLSGTMIVANRRVKALCLNMIRRFHLNKVERAIAGLYETFGRYKTHRGIFFYSIWISLGIQLLNVLVYILLAEGLGVPIPWWYFFLFFPIVTVISMLPISLNGLGTREGMFVYLFSKIQIPSPQVLSLSLSWFLIVTCISLIGGLIFLFRKEI